MIEGKYKWSEKRRELKPQDKDTALYSIRFGDVDPKIFINFKGKGNIDYSQESVWCSKDLPDGDEAIIFLYKDKLYAYRAPEKPIQIIIIKKLTKN